MDMTTLLLLGGLLLFTSILGSTLSARLGFPLLLVFLVLGMLAGEEGLLGIRFDDFDAAFLIANLALALILLDGGLRTRISTFRVALWPAMLLATWGVVATVILLGVFTTWLLDVDWRYGMLLAAIVGSTDAAAVFNLMRHSGVRINERVRATLEIESGTNDPMAILLVVLLIDILIGAIELSATDIALRFLQQFGLGTFAGIGGGWALAHLIRRLHLAEGLYALLIASGGITIFAASNYLGGSGFLAIYLTGLVIGNRRSQSTEHVLKVMDGLAWLAQAGLFLILGLLVTPSALLDNILQALLIATFLMLVARPLMVIISLLPFRFPVREIVYMSWVGLRGAVPVVLAVFPMMAGVPESRFLFEVAFAVVLVSLLIQGTSVPGTARLLGVIIPQRTEPRDSKEIWIGQDRSLELVAFRVEPNSLVAGRRLESLKTIHHHPVQCVLVIRDGQRLPLDPNLELRTGDDVWLLIEPEEAEHVAPQFSHQEEQGMLAVRNFFGEFAINPDLPAIELARAYGLEIDEEALGETIAQLVTRRLGRRPVVGDRISLGHLRLIVRSIEGGRITQIGLKVS